MTLQLKSHLFGWACAVAALGVNCTASAQSLSLRLSSENSTGSNSTAILDRFAEHIEESLGNDVEAEVFTGGVLGDEETHLQMVRSGQIDIHSTGSDAIQLDPKWAIFDLPFIFEDREMVASVLDGEIGEEMSRSMRESAGLEVLGFGEIGFRHMTNNVRPINVPEDLEGLRIRIPGSETRALLLETFGATPVDINLGELYLALQQGTVEGQENPLLAIDSRSFYEVQEYLSLTSHVYTPVTLTMNGEKYDSLTDAQREAVDEAAEHAVQWTRENGADADERLVGEMRERMAVNEVDLPAFREAAEPVYEFVAETAGEEFVEKLLSEIESQ